MYPTESKPKSSSMFYLYKLTRPGGLGDCFYIVISAKMFDLICFLFLNYLTKLQYCTKTVASDKQCGQDKGINKTRLAKFWI